MPGNKVLIAGASGLVGHAAVEHFASLPGWEVIGVSRRVPRDLAGAELLSVDLLDADACAGTFGAMTDVTHLVYAALQEQSGLFQGWLDPELIARNGAMLRHLFEPLSAAASGLRHVSLLHGTKAYGIHRSEVDLASVHVPLRERESRVEHSNFYWVQEDYLRDKQASASWGLTTLRPTVIYGDAPGSNMNPIPVIGVYAALMRERGEPLHFPGPGSEPMLREAVDAELVARALAWAATTPEAYGHAFNLTNGDVFVWEHVWPAIAESLGMEPGEPRPISLAEALPKEQAAWASIVERYDLVAPSDLVEFVGANSLVYADMVLTGPRRARVPFLNSTIAARQAGFAECIDTEDMFRKWFRRLQEKRLLPPAG